MWNGKVDGRGGGGHVDYVEWESGWKGGGGVSM